MGITIDDVLTSDGINKNFMSWLWNKDRQKYAFIMLGHLELITDELIKQYEESETKDGNDD